MRRASRGGVPAGALALSAVAVAALLAACAQTPGAATGAAPAASAAAPAKAAVPVKAGASAARPVAVAASGAASAPPAAPVPGQPPAFAVVIKDAKRMAGSFAVWQKDEKFWLELGEKDFGAPLFLSPKLASGIGENYLYGGLMAGVAGGPQLVEFRRVHNQVQLIARNTDFVARAGTPAARAVAAGYSPSLLGSTPVASQPHPERKTVLVELNPLLLSDLPGIAMHLQRSYRQGYGFDGRNSAITSVRSKTGELELDVQAHYATGSIAVPTPGMTPPGAPVPTVPRTVPDPRSLFIQIHYSLARLPAEPMAGRAPDGRLGHFVSTTSDFSDDLARTPRVRHVNRWRLEKKDPAAALSEPVKPITFWLDRNVPVKYRESIRAGILEWNKAFEAIGFKNAVVVQQQADDADFDTLDLGVASVRWMVNANPSFGAIGPSHVDPRSGEILDADIGFESLSSRNLRAARSQILAVNASTDWAALMQAEDARAEARGLGAAALAAAEHGGRAQAHDAACAHADLAAEQLDYALDLLVLRDGLDPAGPEADAFVQAYMKDVAMHEVGHTLGLRHNFRASRIYTEQQVSDPAFGRTHALTGSVMEYAPINLARSGEPAAVPFQTTLGPYDYWAIEYAYRPLAPAQEAAELQRIAARSSERELAYGTDEDNYLGIDPEALQGDLGDDPVLFARKRLDIARELIQRLESQPMPVGSEYPRLRRVVAYALRDAARAAGVLARQVGAVRTLRDAPGTGRDPLAPLPAAQQRAALDALATTVFSADGLAVSAALQRRLAPDFLERRDALEEGGAAVATDFVPAQAVGEMQRMLLAQLMSDGVAQRLIDSQGKSAGATGSLGLAELYGRLESAIWSELAAARGDITPARRELQLDHLSRLASALLRPAAPGRADVRALQRTQAQALLVRLQSAGKRPGLSAQARAHLLEGADTLREALAARLSRSGV